jgi:hypothetical protein
MHPIGRSDRLETDYPIAFYVEAARWVPMDEIDWDNLPERLRRALN